MVNTLQESYTNAEISPLHVTALVSFTNIRQCVPAKVYVAGGYKIWSLR